jgi:adenosine deaminase
MEGAVRLQTVLDVAQEAGVKLPTRAIEELRRHALITEPMKDLATVLNKFMLVQSCLATPSILKRVAYENCIDAHLDGIRVFEMRYSPGFIAFNHPMLTYDSIHQAIVDGVEKAEKEFKGKLAVGLICIISRDQPAIEHEKTTDFVLQNKSAFVGFDLAGDEAAFPPKLFRKYFDRVRGAGLGITVHCGEVPGSAPWVRDSILELGAQRIGHGIQISHDRSVMDFVREKNVTLENCPTSNVLTQGVDKLENHPLPLFLKENIPVTLNSDDPHIFGIDLTHEYEVCDKVLGLTEDDFIKLNERALKVTFIDQEKVKRAWAD